MLRRLMLAALLTVPLAGCLSLEEDEAPPGTASAATPEVLITGSVGDGPVTGATITVYSTDGEVLGSMVSDNTASFRQTFKVRGNQYPLRLVVSGGIDLVTGRTPDFGMISVMLHPSDKQVNINPFTTLMVMLAEKLPGGLNTGNVDAARPVVFDRLGFGLDPAIIPDPVTTEITDDNAAHLVKASEALGEMVRRTRDLIMATGKTTNGDSILQALAADLTDGMVDGLGGTGANPTVASVANVVSGQVLVEAMSNNLRVGGMIATLIIDQSIAVTRSGISSSQLTDSVLVSDRMLEQARATVAAAQVLDPGDAVTNIVNGIATLSPNSTPDMVETVLPADSTLALDGAVNRVATASASEADAINQVVASGGTVTPPPPPPPVNTPPVISGTPAGSVTANSPYVFQPLASDSDGDSLSFGIANKPSWASFNASTGRLSGTPADSHAGTYGGIVLSVTDGTDTTSLAAFSIQVSPAPIVNTPPVISGAPATSVIATSSYQFQPAASDADGDTLSFSITNKPAWAGFNTATGRISGTPGIADTGTYSGIVISVTDGTDTASLAPFSIGVSPAPVQTGNMTLSWVAPVTRADGTPISMSDIDGYRIYYGASAGTYPNSVDITDGTAATATITNLPVGTYYVVMSTYDMNGLEGAKSAPVTKTVP